MKRTTSIAIAIALSLTLATSCAISERPLTATELLDLGEKYLLELDYEQALVYFEMAIEIDPMNPRGYTGAAEAHIALGDTDSAVAVLQQGSQVLPGNAQISAAQTDLDSLLASPPSEPISSPPPDSPASQSASPETHPNSTESISSPSPSSSSSQSQSASMYSWEELMDFLDLPLIQTSIYDMPGIAPNVIAMYEDGPVPKDDLDGWREQLRRFGLRSSSFTYSQQGDVTGFLISDFIDLDRRHLRVSNNGMIERAFLTNESLEDLWGFSYRLTTKDDVMAILPEKNYQENANGFSYIYYGHGRLTFILDSDNCIVQCFAFWNF